MTNAEYRAFLESCNFRDPNAVSELVTASYTETRFNQSIAEKQISRPNSASNYFTGFLKTETWPDGQGQDYIREYATQPYIPITFSQFVRTMQICDPNLADECRIDYCDIPEGGRGTLPPIQMYKGGWKTRRDCIANIRHIKDFWYWAKKSVEAMALVDEFTINSFSVLSMLRTLGHKLVLQGELDGNGNLIPIANNNPRNPFRAFAYNYAQELFPRPTNLEHIMPLTSDILEILARHWAQFPEGNHVAIGERGQYIYEFWYPDDWYQSEAIRNPDYMEKLKVMMPSKLFAGYSLNPTGREVIGNWAMRSMPWLPRFAESTEGGLIMVDTHENVPIDVGFEPIGSRNFENAPFGLAVSPSPNQGTLLKRPPLTKSGAGIPIVPITGDGTWRIRNEYDKDCNPEQNMPYFSKRFEMGYMANMPQGMGIIFRRRVHRLQPINNCDLAPLFSVAPNTLDCALTTVGCEDNKRRVSDVVTEESSFQYVECSSGACGTDNVTPYLYWLKVEPRGMDNRNLVDCDCGDTVMLAVHDDEGVFLRTITGVIKDTRTNWPRRTLIVETATALAANECIKGIACSDGSILQGFAVDVWASGDDIAFMLESPLLCGSGTGNDAVQIRYYDADGVVIDVIAGTIESQDPSRNEYVISSADPAFTLADINAAMNAGRVGVSCNEGSGTVSSSSSSSSGD